MTMKRMIWKNTLALLRSLTTSKAKVVYAQAGRWGGGAKWLLLDAAYFTTGAQLSVDDGFIVDYNAKRQGICHD